MKMLTNNLVRSSVFLLAILVFSCHDDEHLPTRSDTTSMEMKMMKLGKKLENPYSVANMRIAYNNLFQQSNGRMKDGGLEITTTHRYIKFIPLNESDIDSLQSDTTLHLYDHPLDYEIVEEGEYYHDPEVPVTQPTYQYASIALDHSLPTGVQYEVIEDLYIPEEDTVAIEQGRRNERAEFIEALVHEAMRITGNQPEQNNSRTMGRWTPSGRIRLADDRLGTIGLAGVKVRARRWFTTHTAFTDGNGNFRMSSSFKNAANYSIEWERHDWDIRSGTFVKAVYNGPKREGAWNLDINWGASRMYATVHMACHDYYYGNRFGLKLPPTNNFWKSAIKIAVYEKDEGENGSHCKDCRIGGLIPRLYIYDGARTTQEIYGTTIHELAHASHWELRKNNWNDNNTESRLKESWAEGVEWMFAANRYGQYGDGPNFTDSYQRRGTSSTVAATDAWLRSYTSVVVDLIDNENQRLTRTAATGINLPIDRVAGYTIAQIEAVLSTSNGFTSLRDQLVNRYANASEPNMNELFNNW